MAATAGIMQVTLTWDNPTDDTITEWQYRYTTAETFADADQNLDRRRGHRKRRPKSLGKTYPAVMLTRSATLSKNLDSGKKYTFEVRALAHDTPGLTRRNPSPTNSNVVTLEPGPPVGLEAESGDEQVTLSWADPDDDGIYKWQYRYKAGSRRIW